MRFIVDECTGPAVAQWLSKTGHDVLSVYDQKAGISDDEIIRLALSQERVLITNDKDFGEKIYRERRPHHGVVLLRLTDERSKQKIHVLRRLLDQHLARLEGQFVVATEQQVRFARS